MRALLLTILLAAACPGATVTLYDGTGGTSPSFPWLFVPTGTPPTVTIGGGGTILDTTAADDTRAGYFRTAGPLVRSTGFTLGFNIDLLAEDHSNPNALNNADTIADRAGFSIIALSSDLQGIELGFWMNEVWAQNDGAVKADPIVNPTGTRFTHGEGAAFDFSGGIVRFDLSILNNSYGLYADGALLLSGALRDYSNEGSPYTTANFLFLGDNTSSARGSVKLDRVDLTDSAIVPEPAAIMLTAAGLLAIALSRRSKAS